jgi:hypothetical protein
VRQPYKKTASHNQFLQGICFDSCTDRRERGATIAVMAKFKPAKGKARATPRPPAALPCVVLILVGMVLLGLFLYYVLKNANG